MGGDLGRVLSAVVGIGEDARRGTPQTETKT